MQTRHRRFKNAIYEQIARVGKATASPKRLELLDLLSQGPRTVEALAAEASASVANVSQHLKVLRGSRLVEAEKTGLYVEYRLTNDEVSRFYTELRTLAESQLAEIEQLTRVYFQERHSFAGISVEDLRLRVKRGEVTVLDVRPALEYRAGHIPGALSIPVAELSKRLKELPKGRQVVAYCRGPYCIMAAEAVDLLRKKGLKAERMDAGVVEWRARGWQIESVGEGAFS